MCQCLVKRGVASARAHKLATPSRKPPEEPEQPEQEDQPKLQCKKLDNGKVRWQSLATPD